MEKLQEDDKELIYNLIDHLNKLNGKQKQLLKARIVLVLESRITASFKQKDLEDFMFPIHIALH